MSSFVIGTSCLYLLVEVEGEGCWGLAVEVDGCGSGSVGWPEVEGCGSGDGLNKQNKQKN